MKEKGSLVEDGVDQCPSDGMPSHVPLFPVARFPKNSDSILKIRIATAIATGPRSYQKISYGNSYGTPWQVYSYGTP